MSPSAVADKVNYDVLAEHVAVLERDIDGASDICTSVISFTFLTLWVVAIDVQDGRANDLANIGRVHTRPTESRGCGISDVVAAISQVRLSPT